MHTIFPEIIDFDKDGLIQRELAQDPFKYMNVLTMQQEGTGLEKLFTPIAVYYGGQYGIEDLRKTSLFLDGCRLIVDAFNKSNIRPFEREATIATVLELGATDVDVTVTTNATPKDMITEKACSGLMPHVELSYLGVVAEEGLLGEGEEEPFRVALAHGIGYAANVFDGAWNTVRSSWLDSPS
jgi:hypothetical protein